MIYLDNAATSFPKPPETIRLLNDFVNNVGGNPGRSGHTLSLEAARIIFDTREKLTDFIGMKDSERLVFTQNGTEALNLAILGLLKENDHVVTTSMEHNSVMRPLEFLRLHRGVSYTAVPCSAEGLLDPGELAKAVKKDTRAVIVNHGSNVTGTLQPIELVKDMTGDALFIVDACQTIGSVPLDMEKAGIDILCFSCHKSLFSIQGVGAAYIRKGIDLTPLKFGGTGSKSESIDHPAFLPDKYESGTPNTPGIASLLGGLTFIGNEGIEKIAAKKGTIRELLVKGLRDIDGVAVYGHETLRPRSSLAVVSFNIKGKLASETGYELNKRSIYTRVGLHCCPAAHQAIGTFPQGTVRAAPGYFTEEDDVRSFLEAVREIAER